MNELTKLSVKVAREFQEYVRTVERNTGQEDRRGLPKHLAIVAVRVSTLAGRPIEQALTAAAQAYARLEPSRKSSLKKCLSQARALLEFGVSPEDLQRLKNSLASDPGLAFTPVDELLSGVSLTEALSRRALALAGRRGGRPRAPDGAPETFLPPSSRASPGRVLQATVALLMRAQAGDQRAAAELEQLKAVLRLAPSSKK